MQRLKLFRKELLYRKREEIESQLEKVDRCAYKGIKNENDKHTGITSHIYSIFFHKALHKFWSKKNY